MFQIYLQIKSSVSPAQKVAPVKEQQKRASQVLKDSPKKKSSKLRTIHSKARVSAVPTGICSLFKDAPTMLMMLELFGVTSRVCQDLGTEGAEVVPYLSMLSAPTYLYHASQKAHARLSLMVDAIKVGRVADAFFWGGRGIASAGSAVGNVAKSFSGSIQLAGLTGNVVLGLIFAHIIPTVLVIVGAIGGIAQIGALWRNAQAIQEFEKKVETKPLYDILEYLRGSKEVVEKEDYDTDKAALETLNTKRRLNHANFLTAHFTCDHRYDLLQQHINDYHALGHASERLQQAKTSPQHIERLKKCINMLSQTSDLYTRLITQADHLEGNINNLLSLYAQLEDLDLDDTLRQMVAQNKEQLLSDLAKVSAGDVIDRARSEMHRSLLYNALFLLMTLLVLTDGALGLISPNFSHIVRILAITSSVLDISCILFDKSVTQDQFLKLEKWLGTL